ncbi:hypothetical protein D3C80_1813700 [compost metagenome]
MVGDQYFRPSNFILPLESSSTTSWIEVEPSMYVTFARSARVATVAEMEMFRTFGSVVDRYGLISSIDLMRLTASSG